MSKAAKKPAKAKQPKPPKKKKLSPKDKASLLDGKLIELSAQKNRYSMSVLEWEEAHAHAGERKKTMEKQQAALNQLVTDIVDIRNGNYNLPLPFNGEQGQQVPGTEIDPQVLGDDALTMPLSTLAEYGMTAAKLESVAAACDGNTIGALEKWLREDRDWMKKCKGLGETWIDKLVDSLVAFRKKFPMPEPTVAETPAEKTDPKPEAAPVASV